VIIVKAQNLLELFSLVLCLFGFFELILVQLLAIHCDTILFVSIFSCWSTFYVFLEIYVRTYNIIAFNISSIRNAILLLKIPLIW